MALTILSVAAFLATSTQAFAGESCVEKFAERAALGEQLKRENAGDFMKSAAVTGGATWATYALATFAGIAGGPVTITVFVITLAGTAYIVHTRSVANDDITTEIEPMLLYRQSKAFVQGHKSKLSDMPDELLDTVKVVDQWAKNEKKDFPDSLKLVIPQAIVDLMEKGFLCGENGQFKNAKDLIEILKDMEFKPTS
jgi:hypothetical protein